MRVFMKACMYGLFKQSREIERQIEIEREGERARFDAFIENIAFDI